MKDWQLMGLIFLELEFTKLFKEEPIKKQIPHMDSSILEIIMESGQVFNVIVRESNGIECKEK